MEEENEAGIVREVNASNGTSTYRDDELTDGSTLPPVVSDILHPARVNSPRAPLSQQSNKQNSLGPQNIQIPPLRPSTQIAVHIRSSPVASPSAYTPWEETTAEDDRRSQRAPKAKTPKKVIPTTTTQPPVAQHEMERTSPQPKKRGRPKGWRKPVSQADSRGDSGASESKGDAPREPKRRGRPPRPLPSSVRERYLKSNAAYMPFLCEWKESNTGRRCPAELQNMKTLRKHVDLVHGDEEPLVCRWGKCATRETPIQFAEQTEFETHLEEAHFRSFVWHVGDGYQNDGISELKRDADGLPRYLFDENGNQVTPSVTEQQFEGDQHWKERKKKLRRLLIQREEAALTDEEYMKQTLGIP
ncbi:hypothetical protein M426DRAFT_321764 [Hypoxylon sp. CI-4A]|nr:hypothetical protein M426DRAFT_321764 [Hypoxylon sp. CI-4A]